MTRRNVQREIDIEDGDILDDIDLVIKFLKKMKEKYPNKKLFLAP